MTGKHAARPGVGFERFALDIPPGRSRSGPAQRPCMWIAMQNNLAGLGNAVTPLNVLRDVAAEENARRQKRILRMD